MEGVPDHLSADESQDRKGNDASILGDEIAHQLTQDEPYNGHEELEKAESKGHGKAAGA